MSDDEHRSTDPSPVPSSMLPDVDPDAAPYPVLHVPENPLPNIDLHEASTLAPPVSLPRDAPTPKQRLRRDVAETLRRAEQAVQQIKEAARHPINEPVNVVDALEKLNALSDARADARLADHEQEEKADAAKLTEKVDAVEKKRAEDARNAAAERAALATKLDKLVTTVERTLDPKMGLPAMLKEVAAQIASPFLARDDERKKQVEELTKEVYELKTDFNAAKLNHDRRLSAVEAQLKQLAPKSVDDVTT